MTRRVLRRSQAVVPFGVGSMLDLPGESLMAAGLDSWNWPASPEEKIYDERLARRLGVSYFRQPPAAERLDGRRGNPLPFVRFPLWHFCPRCRMLQPVSSTSLRPPRCRSETAPLKREPCASLPKRKQRVLVPLRFVAACSRGHIEDFPWIAWVHTEKGKDVARGTTCDTPVLRFPNPVRAGLGGLVFICQSCDAKRSLLGAASPAGIKGFQCHGERPWLGQEGRAPDGCNETMRMLQRGATSIHFSRTASSILIPPFSSKISRIVDEEWSRLRLSLDGVQPDRTKLEVIAEVIADQRQVDRNTLLEAVLERFGRKAEGGQAQSEQEYRVDEYRALLSTAHDPEDQLVLKRQPSESFGPSVREYFENIVQVERLAETRALIGFSRINPSSEGPSHVDWDMLSLGRKRWLPAFRVLGEGLFLTLDRVKVQHWLTVSDKALNDLEERQRRVLLEKGGSPREVPGSFVLLHTLAHLLIRQLSFECGYGSSSLRERIYCSAPSVSDDRWMCGVLIYTAAGDTEGTLGGLVSQGNPGRFEAILENTLLDAWWCASDPLCRDSSGQGADSLNLAACHACALLPETSCEEGNRLLDRMTLIGTSEATTGPRRGAGFFQDLALKLLAR